MVQTIKITIKIEIDVGGSRFPQGQAIAGARVKYFLLFTNIHFMPMIPVHLPQIISMSSVRALSASSSLTLS